MIVAIDGKPIDASKAMEPLRGASGSKVVLTIVRDKTPKPFDVTLQRETIRVASVRSKMLEPGYGYIRISTFQADTGADFQKNLKQLQAGGKLRGLVLDLRSNPGGLLTSAVQVADDLLDKGNIVSTRGRISISDAKFDATRAIWSTARRSWCWWTPARPVPRKCWPGRCATTSVHASSAAAPSVGFGADRAAAGQRRLGQAHHRALLHAEWQVDPGQRHRAGRDAHPEPQPGDADVPASLTDYNEATLPGHLRGDDEGEEGYSAGDVLPGDGPISEALAELKQPGSAAKAQAARKAKAQAAQKAKAAKTGAEPKPAAAPGNHGQAQIGRTGGQSQAGYRTHCANRASTADTASGQACRAGQLRAANNT